MKNGHFDKIDMAATEMTMKINEIEQVEEVEENKSENLTLSIHTQCLKCLFLKHMGCCAHRSPKQCII